MFNKAAILLYYQRDSQDRENNLAMVLNFYRRNAPDIEIHLIEEGIQQTVFIPKISYTFWDKEDETRRTLAFNCMARNTNRDVVISHDVDTLIDTKSLELAIKETYNTPLVIPYNGTCVDLHKIIHEEIKIVNSNEILKKYLPPLGHRIGKVNAYSSVMNNKSIGGIVCFNRLTYLATGGYNPNFRGWGWEDVEIIERYMKLGFKNCRVYNPQSPVIFHLNHDRPNNDYMKAEAKNLKIYNLVKSMSKEQTEDYIKTWTL